MVFKTKSSLVPEVLNLIDIAAKITLFFYSLLLLVGTTEEIFKNSDLLGLVYVPVGVVFFALHVIYSGKYKVNKENFLNDIRTASSFKRGIYYLLLSMSLAIFVMSFANNTLRQSVESITNISGVIGGIMSTYVVLFFYLLLLSLFRGVLTKLSAQNILMTIFVVVLLYLLFRYTLYFIDQSNTAKEIGLFLLGPINLLIVRFLSDKNSSQKKYLIRL